MNLIDPRDDMRGRCVASGLTQRKNGYEDLSFIAAGTVVLCMRNVCYDALIVASKFYK